MKYSDLVGSSLRFGVAAALVCAGANLTGVNPSNTYQDDMKLSGATWTDGRKVCAAGSVETCK